MDALARFLKDDDSFHGSIALGHGLSQEEEKPWEGAPHLQDTRPPRQSMHTTTPFREP